MNEQISILAVDDEIKITEVVKSFLEAKGYRVTTAANGGDALTFFAQGCFSLVLLDLMLPDLSGETVCLRLRENSSVPIIMVTARVEEEDMLKGLHLGADDYIRKPFSLKELHARIEAVLRRTQGSPAAAPAEAIFNRRLSFSDGNLRIDLEQHTAIKKGCFIPLTHTEFELLSSLAKRPSKTFTREELITLILGQDFDGFDRTVDSHIKNLRKKLEDDPKNPVYIKTVHGVGYRFGGE